MSDAVTIQDKMVVGIHYRLTNDSGDELDTSIGFDPLFYLHGARNIVPGLENELLGLSVGDKKEVVVAPADGYGEKQNKEPVAIARNNFPPNIDLQKGMMFHAEGPDGQPVPLWVTEVTNDSVMVDTEHPLAGVTLKFEVEVVEIRAASEEELANGYVRGPDGTQN